MLSKEQKQIIIGKIQEYFMEERGEEMGELAAENIYQFMKEDIAPYFYNEGIHDARLMAEQKMDSLDEDIRSLEKQVHRSSSR